MAIKGEGYTIPVEPAQSILAVPKVLEKKKLSSPSVRIVDPKENNGVTYKQLTDCIEKIKNGLTQEILEHFKNRDNWRK